ncbi:uncharacterized protein JCM15063_005040 [Sporobolomyces koalae]|uniref:uncharacterized protein n=1 Tax=Sporobolomyces koalae TaxID=500713 RepID=UPI00316F8B60
MSTDPHSRDDPHPRARTQTASRLPAPAPSLPPRPLPRSALFVPRRKELTRAKPRAEDAQPSEAVTSNYRPKAPPSIMTASASDSPRPATWRAHSEQRRAPTGPATYRDRRPPVPTTAGGWSSSGSRPYDSGPGKGKEPPRWYARTPNPARFPLARPTPVPVPINPDAKIYVSQLPQTVTEQELRTVFKPYGDIESIRLRPQNGFAFAHIAYAHRQSASDAIANLNTKPFPSETGVGSSRPLRVEYAIPPQQSRLHPSHPVTTEAPVLESEPARQQRLFRERDTPELSQGQRIKSEFDSPVQTPRRPRSTSPRWTPPATTPLRPQFPTFLTPPELSCNDMLFPPLRLGTLASTSTSTPRVNQNELPRYVLSYRFSRRIVTDWARLSPRDDDIASWLASAMSTSSAGSNSGMALLRDSIQIKSARQPSEDILTFMVEVPPDTLKRSGRDDNLSQEEAVVYTRQMEKLTQQLQAQLEEGKRRERQSPQLDDSRIPEITGEMRHGAQPDGTFIEKIPLPEALLGTGPDQLRQQTLLRVEEVKKRSLEGKVVLGSSIEGNYISINYFIDEPDPPAARPPNESTPTNPNEDVPMADEDDVKPVIARNLESSSETAEEPSFLSPPTRFPLAAIKNSRADSVETYQAVSAFMNEYFRRFDSARSTLEEFYTQNAFFSLKIDTTAPRRLTSPITLFSRTWFQSANKFASTPIAVVNAIRRLPAGSHNLDTVLFDASAIPEFHLRKRGKTPILLHIVGDFEEFPEKVVRRFERTMVLVPRANGSESEAGSGSGEFIVHSDQMLVGHHAGTRATDLEVTDPPFSPRPVLAPSVKAPPTISRAEDRPDSALNEPPFSPPPSHRRHVDPERAPVSNNKRPRSLSQTSTAPGHARQPSSNTSRHRAASSSYRQSESETLVLSDTDSAASNPAMPHEGSNMSERGNQEDEGEVSLSPEAIRPTKRLYRSTEHENGSSNTRQSKESSHDSSSSESTMMEELRPNGARPRPSTTTSSTVVGSQTVRVSPPSAHSTAARDLQVLPEQLQKYIAEQVAMAVQEKLRDAGTAPIVPGKDGASSQKNGKSRVGTDDQASKEKKKKVKDRKDKFVNGLGTGLSSKDSRIVISGVSTSILHGFDGRSNKLRGMVQTAADPASFLSVSFLGDIAEWSLPPPDSGRVSTITKLYASNQDRNRVDDFSYNQAKDTLLVGYLGAKDGKELASPPNQVVLYKRNVSATETKLVETRLTDAPHVNGGVTAIMALPNKVSTGRLRFVTGGEDKKLYLWTRQRSTQAVKLDKFRTEHTSMITGLAYLEARDELVSGGKDRRVVTYDLETRLSTWQATLASAVMSVAAVTCDPNLILSRLATPSEQFLLHDRRVDPTSPPVFTFGYDLAPHRSLNGTLQPTNMGRYLRGDQKDTVVVFPDYDQGVKMWDLRHLKNEIVKKQDLAGLGRSKVVQASFRNRSELCLMELSHFSRLSIKG